MLLGIAFLVWRYCRIYGAICADSCAVSNQDLEDKKYDFVIVGGGTAGCILASRLSEHRGTTVLLLEAGKKDDGAFFRFSILGATFMSTPHHWNLYTQPEQELIQTDAKSRGRVLIQCRAKCLGGCSSLNLAIWHRGNTQDYDYWESELGCKGWGWKNLQPYFDKCEGKGYLKRASGFFSTSTQMYVSKVGRLFEKACAQALKIPIVGDFLQAPMSGVGRPYNMVFEDGLRCNAVRAYLTRRGSDGVRVCDRPNLTIATGVRVSKLVMERNKEIKSVFFVRGVKSGTVHASREVLLCAGTIHSPLILMNSGIGPKEVEDCFIRSRAELPGVGRNLRDFVSSGVVYECKLPSIDKCVKSPASLATYALGLSSPLLSNTMEGFAFTKSNVYSGDESKTESTGSIKRRLIKDERPDLMFSLQSARFPFACVGSYTDCISDSQSGELPNAMTIHATLLRPQSKGSVRIRCANAFNSPLIFHNYLSDSVDMKHMIAAIKRARKIVQSSAFDDVRGKEVLPGPSVQTDEEIEDYIRKSSCHFFGTLVGTCKMGAADDENAVVDCQLRVRKVGRLRVVDASVIPAPVSGFNHATVAAIAEKAADLIKEEYKLI
eukprot:CAMPEP_0184479964 /NCGR_PEP_ID=MMETSP0113_2-20130426/1474_1 /TAXON_ID=91329 /ORGANISM="Norrisiella sphaerica, Strain BC52" /LENGTH=605 /DNA_ID=CAMNT_0026858141 /DNA_START=242 /DNA_END=2059 /DNA_ORIENTATION=-